MYMPFFFLNFDIKYAFVCILFGFCRIILLSNGIEKLIRKAKVSHESCKDAATAALRDLGLDDYNT